MWRRNLIFVISSFRGNGFLGIKVSWRNSLYYIVNIYSSCFMSLKRILWRDLLDLMNKFNDGEWLLGGDFKILLHSGRSFQISSRTPVLRMFLVKGVSIVGIVEMRGPRVGLIDSSSLILLCLIRELLVNLLAYTIFSIIFWFGYK